MLSTRTGSYSYSFVHDPGPVKMMGYRTISGILLEDEFSCYPSRGSAATQVRLTKDTVFYEKTGVLGDARELRIDLWDLAGVSCGRHKGRNGIIAETNTASKSDIGAYMCLYYYPYNKPAGEGGVRQRREVIFRYSKEDTYEKNLAVVQRWRIAIELLLKNVEVNNVTDIRASRLPPRRKLLVFINPASGRGKGEQVFDKQVAPVLRDAGIEFNKIVTTRQNHAKEKVREMDLKECRDGIVIVSGDGLVYEVLNGLMERPDKETALKIPIGVIPAGSGNAMSSAILCRLGEGYNKNAILHAAFILTKPGSRPLDLIITETPQEKLVSFLSVAWGIIADIDIESERYRFLGAARFTFGALVRIVNLRHYRGKLSYIPLEDTSKYNHMMPRDHNVVRVRENDTIHEDDDLQREHMTRHHSTYEIRADPAELTSSGVRGNMSRHLSVTQDLSRSCDLTFNDKFIKADDDTNGYSPREGIELGQDCGVKLTLSNQRDSIEGDDSGLQLTLSGESHNLSSSDDNSVPCVMDSDLGDLKTTLLPPLSEPLPPGWLTLDKEEFVGIVVTYMSHLSQDVKVWPGREFDEGCMLIQYCKGSSTRKNLLDLMEAFVDGSHIEKGLVEIIYCRAFRLEPITENGILTIDGEKVEYGPIQAEVLPNLKATVLTPTKH